MGLWPASGQVDKNEHHAPHHAHEVPVDGYHREAAELAAELAPTDGAGQDPKQEAEPHQHVNRVEAGKEVEHAAVDAATDLEAPLPQCPPHGALQGEKREAED